MHLTIDSNTELRPLEISDAHEVFNLIDAQRKYLGKWLTFVATTKKASDTEAFVKSVVRKPKECKEHTFTIRYQNKLIGLIGLDPTDIRNGTTEIGYWLSEVYQKQGIVTKSVQRLCEFAFHDLELNKVIIKCAVHNEPSKNIPKRLGFSFDGVQRQTEVGTDNNFNVLEVYSKLKSKE